MDEGNETRLLIENFLESFKEAIDTLGLMFQEEG